ncbi:flagellar basal-body rod protein FlgB [Caldicellulosiruptor bescii]|uniref:Flagellar basal body rod protein FlgB n=2 Tax=Caldicellulosiruptor bescii TaxID=31899 RepID=B9MM28_CALBD|nr:flagellar basal body rod protein FlgB [Caldicellulosiruptor bescii]ACM61251.1 flagellar basal-body rod protein FlgB [Caldicellulosiruptor bescii DSM 6725]PBC88936.1 flagellar basal-body rod protein FlgB [Caldicellulosiruptor bescii]PBC91582.1 flagellar basal-body rod protein FlgB [Caldicellulosiruptor bescii]PBD03005.1 flagellar basal-body rod protein FlgB [Caldicellulosiruptor bescii]PBD07379.1 flagellar basal-body rod protein FlgB [Caldicellulosiruptor bescii]
MINMFDKIDLYKKALDWAWERNKIISNNIANADTPGYKAKDLNFRAFLQRSLNQEESLELVTTNERHIKESSSNPDNSLEVLDSSLQMRLDQNTVDIEQEMGKLLQNSLYFDGVSLQLSREINKWKTVIKEGR